MTIPEHISPSVCLSNCPSVNPSSSTVSPIFSVWATVKAELLYTLKCSLSSAAHKNNEKCKNFSAFYAYGDPKPQVKVFTIKRQQKQLFKINKKKKLQNLFK